MSREKYRGWTNRATWNIALWLNNEPGSYYATQEYTQQLRHLATAEDAEQWISAFYPSGQTPDGDLLADADWEELAAMLREDQQEYDPELYAEMEEESA